MVRYHRTASRARTAVRTKEDMKSISSLLFLCLSVVPSLALADVAPEPGQTRVAYRYRVDSAIEGHTLVAYPTYTGKDDLLQVMSPGTDYRTVQGYRPGIYSVADADVTSLPKTSEEVRGFLEAHAAVCVKEVPRVFQVTSSDGFNEMVDVLHARLVDGKCKTSLASTVYSGNGKTGEGSVLANGKRSVPSPFGGDVPGVGDVGLDLSGATPAGDASPKPTTSSAGDGTSPADSSSTTKPRGGGCGACATSAAEAPVLPGAAAMTMLALAALLRRRSRSC